MMLYTVEYTFTLSKGLRLCPGDEHIFSPKSVDVNSTERKNVRIETAQRMNHLF